MKVLFDNNLAPALARALNELFVGQHEIIALRDKFPANTADIDWINALNKEGKWVIISGDRRITRNKAEKRAFVSSKLIGFFLSSSLKDAKVTIQMQRILALWDDICLLADRVDGGSLFELQRKSGIRQLRL